MVWWGSGAGPFAHPRGALLIVVNIWGITYADVHLVLLVGIHCCGGGWWRCVRVVEWNGMM